MPYVVDSDATRFIPIYREPSAIAYSGSGKISGVVKVMGALQPNATVMLFTEGSKDFIASQTTDSGGYFEFLNLPTNLQFFVVAKDQFGVWEYRVSSRRTPV